MKTYIIVLLLAILCLHSKAQVHRISGIIYDEHKQKLGYVNVFIDGTMDGSSSDNDGFFVLETEEKGIVTLKATFIGYEPFSITKNIVDLQNLRIYMKPVAKALNEVVVVAGNYALKSSSTLESKNAIDLITTAGSEGDLYKSLAMMPGTQASGTDGRLLVRGGSSRESQTYIDGMHVLSPYTAATGDVSSRGRYSSFLFDGIHFSMGGYSPEYTQSLSSVLPLDTKDKSPISKFGVDLMNVSVGTGGTKAWEKGSASFNLNYTDMTMYNAMFHAGEKKLWDIPYRAFSAENQWRFDVVKDAILKIYAAYSKTRFRHVTETAFTSDTRNMDYNENNLYLNATFKKKFSNGVDFFAGAAYSGNSISIHNARVAGDHFNPDEQELHLKVKAGKRLTSFYKLETGVESYVKTYSMRYGNETTVKRTVDDNISGLFISNDLNLTENLFLNLSGRMEYSSLKDRYALLPRAALSYQVNGFTASGVIGKYQQTAANDYLIYNDHLSMETNVQSMLGFYYQNSDRIYRIELYNKEYDHLPLLVDGAYTSEGYGHSRGIDIFFNDRRTAKRLEYVLAYSYNDSKRKYLDYPEEAVPAYVTKHNASVTLKYTNWEKWRTSVGITNSFADGWTYHNPNKAGFMNDKTTFYHTLDLSLTVLAHKKVIVYTCASNVLNRNNIYGYTFSKTSDLTGKFASSPTRMYRNQAFYIGVFITLGKNVAYESSNF